MPKTKKEAREEDAISREPWQIQLVKHTQNPPRESLSANAILPSTQTTPMAEMATLELAEIKMIEHQLIKAEGYCATLPATKADLDALIAQRVKDLETNIEDKIASLPQDGLMVAFAPMPVKCYDPLPTSDQATYKERIYAFKKEHYADYDDAEPDKDCKEFILLSGELRHQLYMHSLSVMGAHAKDAQDMGRTIIESMGVSRDDTGGTG